MRAILKIQIVAILLLILACSKFEYNRDNKKFFKEYKNSTWELINVTDANGIDITSTVLSDSMYCQHIKLTDKVLKKNEYYEAIYSDCKKCLFENYLGYWGVFNSEEYEDSFYIHAMDFYFVNSSDGYESLFGNIKIENNQFSIYLLKKYSHNLFVSEKHTYKKID